MPPIVISIVSIIQLVASFAPQATEIYNRARSLFDTLFSGGIITAEQQAALKAWADAHELATLNGDTPPELLVEKDPD